MNITIVKKIKADGSPCRRSATVLDDLEQSGLIARIDRVLAADERDPASEGFAIAETHNVASAPFFLVERDDGVTVVYTLYSRFLREVFNQDVPEETAIAEILDHYPDLEFI